MKVANIIEEELNMELINKNELWVSLFSMSSTEEIYSIKPTRIKVNMVSDDSDEHRTNISFIGDKGKDLFYIKILYVVDNNGSSILQLSESTNSIYEVEFFETKKEAEKYYRSELKKYIKHYGNLINKIKEYE